MTEYLRPMEPPERGPLCCVCSPEDAEVEVDATHWIVDTRAPFPAPVCLKCGTDLIDMADSEIEQPGEA